MEKTRRRGVLLAGGTGSRLRPATTYLNKHLIPLLTEPMILYPLRTLKRLGVNDVLLISGGGHIGGFADFLGDGSEYGVSMTYKVQRTAGGIAEALSLAEDFYDGSEKVITVLGDNIFDNEAVAVAIKNYGGVGPNDAAIFTKNVKNPGRFGVIELDANGSPVGKIIEKPTRPRSNTIVTGLYVYPPDVFSFISTLTPSKRGELEITDINNRYIEEGRCAVIQIKDGFWSDAGTPKSLFEATKWVYQKNFN